MIKIVGISSSLRKHSFNSGLLRAAAEWLCGVCCKDENIVAIVSVILCGR